MSQRVIRSLGSRTGRVRAPVRALLLAALMFAAWPALATPPIAGLWASFDDQGKPTGFVRITDRGGEVVGVIERGLPGDTRDPLCRACRGELKDRPMIGLQIINGAHADGDDYVGGHILDPFSGNIYRLRLTPTPDGQRLRVRGFIGLEMLGRTQIWIRQP